MCSKSPGQVYPGKNRGPEIAFLAGLVIILFCFLFLVACSKPDTYDSQGKPINLSNYHGRWLLVNYWASWCVPCLRELPDLNRFYLQHKNKVMVLGVSFDQWPPNKINQFVKKYHVAFPMLSAFPKEKYGVNHIPTVPITLLITPKGTLKTVLHGPQEMQGLEKMIGLSV